MPESHQPDQNDDAESTAITAPYEPPTPWRALLEAAERVVDSRSAHDTERAFVVPCEAMDALCDAVDDHKGVTRARRDALEQVKAELKAKGYTWFSFGRRYVTEEGTELYWFNGSRSGTGRGALAKQPFGWFTLDEMRAEKFAEGCRYNDAEAAS